MVQLRPKRSLSGLFSAGDYVASGGASTIANVRWVGPRHLEVTTTGPLTNPDSRWCDVTLTYHVDTDWARATESWAKR